MMTKPTDDKSPEELAEEERQAAIARGDILDDDAKKDDDDDDPSKDGTGADDDAADDDDDGLDDNTDDDDDDEPGDDPDDDIQIPKARYDQDRKASKAREAALQARIDALEKGSKKSDEPTIADMENDLDELENKYEGLLLEGELEKAQVVRKDMRKMSNAIVDRRIDEKSTAMGTAAVEQVRYDNQLASLEAKHPQMNPDAVEFDEKVADEVGVLMTAFEGQGMTMTKALNKAVHYVFGKAPEPKKEEDDPDPDKAAEVRAARKKKAAKKALDTVKKTPTDLKDVGRNSDKGGKTDGLPDPLKMTQDQFDKLTDAQKAELRDDTLKVH